MTVEAGAPPGTIDAGAPSTGYLASTLGTLIGANLGGFGLGLAGGVLAIPLIGQPGSGGWEALIGAILGFGLGWPVGGALGCLAALRVRGHQQRGRSALLTAGLLVAVLVLFVFVSGRLPDGGLQGWSVFAALQLGVIGSALLARRLTRPPSTA